MESKTISEFAMVRTEALPEVFLKVLSAKKLIEQGIAKTVQEAVDAVGLSRSAFYKYRDAVYPTGDDKGHTVTMSVCLSDSPGILSDILNIIAGQGANILTINQTIPLNCVAYVTITIQTGNMDNSLSVLLEKIEETKGVCSIKILSGE